MPAATSITSPKFRSAASSPEPALFTLDSITAGGVKKISDRDYQVTAVQGTCAGLRDGGRGQIRMACGTGKTVVTERAAEILCPPGGVVVVLCPSIGLVAQTLREWANDNKDHVALAVCGDEKVSDSVVTVAELPADVTTDPEIVADWLRTPTSAGIRLIVGTHRSAHVVGEGLQLAGTVAEVLIVDEAHHSAGDVAKHIALVHDDDRLPARRRIYATATPKFVRAGKGAKADRIVDMSDYDTFGPVLARYTFAQAIEDGWLDNYRLVVMGVTRAELKQYFANLPRHATTARASTTLHTAMVQTVLARAARQFDLRRVLAFCNRLSEAEDFARSMPATLRQLPADRQPDRPLYVSHVNGGMTTTQREYRLERLAIPPNDGWTVLTNVRCLTEGVDVPATDCVVFSHAKQSMSEIIQAVGRALRRDPSGTGIATILVPILLPDGADPDAEIDLSDYKLLWQVVCALRAHDDAFHTTLNRVYANGTRQRYYYEPAQPLEHILVDLPPGYDGGSILEQLTARIVSSGADRWWRSFGFLQRYHDEYGHVNVAPDYVTPGSEKFQLGKWCQTVRTAHRGQRLDPDRVTALTELGFDFLPRAVEWANGIAAAKAFYAEHEHLEPVRSLQVLGVELLAWLDKQRALAAAGKLDASRKAALDELGMRWGPRLETFADYLAALTAHHQQHGDINILPDPDTDKGRLGMWLVKIRVDKKLNKLTPDEIASLEALGIDWRPRRAASQQAPA